MSARAPSLIFFTVSYVLLAPFVGALGIFLYAMFWLAKRRSDANARHLNIRALIDR